MASCRAALSGNASLICHLFYNTLSLKKISHLETLCKFVKSLPIFKIVALLESVWNLLQNPYDITHLTLGMLLHYLGKLIIQIFCKYSTDMEENANKLHFCRLWLSYWSTNFNIFGVSYSEFFAVLTANKNFPSHCSFTCLLLQSICGIGNSSEQTAVFVNDQRDIQQRVQDFNKST